MARTKKAQEPAPQSAASVAVGTGWLDRALTQIAPAMSTRTTLPALAGVKITPYGDGLTIAGTNLELTAEVAIPGAAHGDPFVVHYGMLRQALSSIGDEMAAISLTYDAPNVRIGGNGALTLRALPIEDFPNMPEAEGVKVVTECGSFVDRFLRISTMASSDQVRPVLCAVLMELQDGVLHLTATDSYRLASVSVPTLGPTGESLKRIIPTQMAKALKPFADTPGPLRITIGDTQVSFAMPNGLILTTRTVEGEFPNWRSLIPTGQPVGRLEVTTRLLTAISAGEPFLPSGTGMRITFAEDESVLSTGGQDSAEWQRSVRTSWVGESLTVGYNPVYLRSILSLAGTGALFHLVDGLKPSWATWTEPDGSQGVSLVMPVRLQ